LQHEAMHAGPWARNQLGLMCAILWSRNTDELPPRPAAIATLAASQCPVFRIRPQQRTWLRAPFDAVGAATSSSLRQNRQMHTSPASLRLRQLPPRARWQRLTSLLTAKNDEK